MTNLVIFDETERCGLTLLDSDVEGVKSGKIKIGSRINIVNDFAKVSDFGLEVNIGR